MITGVQNFICQRAGLIQENILSSLTENQKRIAAVVAIIFTAIGAIYLAIACYRRKSDVQAKQIETPDQENLLAKKEYPTPKIEKEAGFVPEPKSRIPSIGGRFRWHGIDGEELFKHLYDKQFLDPEQSEQDKAIVKVIDDFGDLIQSEPYGSRIIVGIFDGDQGPNYDKRPKDLDETGCHFHIYTVHHSFGSSTYRQLAIDYGLIKKFKELKEKDDKSELKALLLKVVDEMRVALREEEKRVSQAQKK